MFQTRDMTEENITKNCSKPPRIRRQWTVPGSVHCTQKHLCRSRQTYANLQYLSIKLFIWKLSKVINSTNQILIPGAGITERRASMECLQAPLCTPSSPDRSRLVPLALGNTRAQQARPKPHRCGDESSCWLLPNFQTFAEMQPPVSKLNPRIRKI